MSTCVYVRCLLCQEIDSVHFQQESWAHWLGETSGCHLSNPHPKAGSALRKLMGSKPSRAYFCFITYKLKTKVLISEHNSHVQELRAASQTDASKTKTPHPRITVQFTTSNPFYSWSGSSTTYSPDLPFH